MAYLRAGIDGGRQGSSLVRNRIMDIRGDLATGGRLVLSTTEPTVVDGNELGRIDFQAPLDTAGTDAILVAASIYAEADATFSSSVNATELVFATGASEAAAEKMRITSDGKVGIGTAAPDRELTVGGVSNCRLGIKSTGDASQLHFGDAADSQIGRLYYDHTGNSLRIHVNASERMRIDSSGNVGIGVTAPASLLHVAGTVQVGVDDTGHDVKFFGATSGSYMLWDQSTDDLILGGAARLGIGTTAPEGYFDLAVSTTNSFRMHRYGFNGGNFMTFQRSVTHSGSIFTLLHVSNFGGSAGIAFRVEGVSSSPGNGTGGMDEWTARARVWDSGGTISSAIIGSTTNHHGGGGGGSTPTLSWTGSGTTRTLKLTVSSVFTGTGGIITWGGYTAGIRINPAEAGFG